MTNEKELIRVNSLYTVNFFDLSPTFHTNFHNHDCWELFYVDSGEVNCITDDDSRMLKSGDVVFHQPGSVHNTVCNGKKSAAIFNVLFYIDSPSMEILEGKSLAVPSKLLPTLRNLINECNKTYRVSEHPLKSRKNAPFGGEQISRIYLEEFLILIIRELQSDRSDEYSAPENDMPNPLIEDICEFLAENIYSTVTLSTLCDKYHFGKSHLSEQFKKCKGCSIMSFYLNLKLTEAKRLLREEDLNIGQISEKLGFESPEYFSKYFKKRVGYSPREFRKMLINNAALKKREL